MLGHFVEGGTKSCSHKPVFGLGRSARGWKRSAEMKTIALMFAALCAAVSLTACGGGGGTSVACGVGQELEPGQGCRIPGGGEFRVESDGCVKTVPDIPGFLSLGHVRGSINMSSGQVELRALPDKSICIRGHVGKGKFKARENAEKSLWRIESLPEAN